jgi:hypothetical protein
MTEAMEAARGSLQRALSNLAFQVVFESGSAVVEMYEEAARHLGATQDQIDRARRP